MFSGHGPRFLGAAAGCLAVGFAKGSGKSRCDGREASRGSGLAAGIHGLSAVKNIMRLERIDSTGWSLEDGDSRRWWRPSTWSWFRHERPEGRVTGSHHGDDNGEGWDEIMSKRTIKRVSRVVNAAMDLDYFGEEDEQKIFEFTVTLILESIMAVLPPPFKMLIRSSEETGIDEETAGWLKHELLCHVNNTVSLPFMLELHRKLVSRCVVELLVESMKAGKSFEQVTHIGASGGIYVEVFVKGSVELLTSMDATVDLMAENLQIPVVPVSVVKHFCRRVCDWVAERLDGAIQASYEKRLVDACKKAAENVEKEGTRSEPPDSLKRTYSVESGIDVSEFVPSEMGEFHPANPMGMVSRTTFTQDVRRQLIGMINDEIDLPFLNEEQEARLFAVLIDSAMQMVDPSAMEFSVDVIVGEYVREVLTGRLSFENVGELFPHAHKPPNAHPGALQAAAERKDAGEIMSELLLWPVTVLGTCAAVVFCLVKLRGAKETRTLEHQIKLLTNRMSTEETRMAALESAAKHLSKKADIMAITALKEADKKDAIRGGGSKRAAILDAIKYKNSGRSEPKA